MRLTNRSTRLMKRNARRSQRRRKRPKPLKAMTGMRMTMTRAAWTHYMSQVGRTLKGLTKKETNKHRLIILFSFQTKTNKYMYTLIVDFNPFSYSTDSLFSEFLLTLYIC